MITADAVVGWRCKAGGEHHGAMDRGNLAVIFIMLWTEETTARIIGLREERRPIPLTADSAWLVVNTVQKSPSSALVGEDKTVSIIDYTTIRHP